MPRFSLEKNNEMKETWPSVDCGEKQDKILLARLAGTYKNLHRLKAHESKVLRECLPKRSNVSDDKQPWRDTKIPCKLYLILY